MSQQINLYEPRLRPLNDWAVSRKVGPAALVVLGVLSLIAGLAVWDARSKTASAVQLQKQQTELQTQLAALNRAAELRKASPALAAELEGARAALAIKVETMAKLESGNFLGEPKYAGFMKAFARQAGRDLWLTGFSIWSGDGEIEIRGRVLDPTHLPAYVQGLSAEPAFQGRRFFAFDMKEIDREAPEGVPASAVVPPPPNLGAPDAGPSRFVEFVLRSEHTAPVDAASAGGKR